MAAETSAGSLEEDPAICSLNLANKSLNTPFLGQRLTGRPVGVVMGNAVRMVPAHAAVGA